MNQYRIFIGTDYRQPVAYTTLQSSIVRRASRPVSITPLLLHQLPMKRRGLTDFTYSRYIPPYLCNFEGWSLFLDADMLVSGDICELFELANNEFDVMVVKNKLRFEWPSLMLFNNAKCSILTPEYIDDEQNQPMKLEWAWAIGELPAEWNHCVPYDGKNPDAKLIHYTQGIPCFPETRECEHAEAWNEDNIAMLTTAPWEALMGGSIHADHVRHANAIGKKDV